MSENCPLTTTRFESQDFIVGVCDGLALMIKVKFKGLHVFSSNSRKLNRKDDTILVLGGLWQNIFKIFLGSYYCCYSPVLFKIKLKLLAALN